MSNLIKKKDYEKICLWLDTDIDGLEFDSGKHKIHIGIGSDMFGNKFYTGGRIRIYVEPDSEEKL